MGEKGGKGRKEQGVGGCFFVPPDPSLRCPQTPETAGTHSAWKIADFEASPGESNRQQQEEVGKTRDKMGDREACRSDLLWLL